MNGLVLLDKPEGYTSFKAAAVLRRIYNIKRVGHTGTLDPLATGVLPVLIGRATRLCSLVLEADKRYTAGVRLGITTDSLDITGEVLSRAEPCVSDSELNEALEHFKGTYGQIPPMFSALKKDGVRLYDLARQGVEIEREPRNVTIREINLLSRNGNDFQIDVLCSKGTYIRSLVDDIGRLLGCGATMTTLRRTSTAQFNIADCVTLEQIEADPEGCLLSAERAVEHLNIISVTEGQKKRFLNGAELSAERLNCPKNISSGELFRVKFGDEFLGLGEYFDDGTLRSKCVIAE